MESSPTNGSWLDSKGPLGRPVKPPFGPSSQSKAMRAGTSGGAGGFGPPFHNAFGIHCGHVGGCWNQSKR